MGRRSLTLRVLLAVQLVAGMVAALPAVAETRAATGFALSIRTAECADPFPLDGAPLTDEACPTTRDRAFTLTRPDGFEIELETTLQYGGAGPQVRAVRWTPNIGDDARDQGTYRLTETSLDPGQSSFFQCLFSRAGRLSPVLLFPVRGGVEFDWTPSTSGTEGTQLTCDVFTRPVNPSEPEAGMIRVYAGLAELEDGSDLVVRRPGASPYGLRRTENAAVPPLSYTLSDEIGREVRLEAPGADGGSAVTNFPVEPGDYTLTADATGTSVDVRVDPRRTTLVFNPITETVASQGTDSVADDDGTAPPAAEEPSDAGPSGTEAPPVLTPAPADDSPLATVSTLSFSAADWTLAYPNINTDVYQRGCVAVYGSASANPRGQLTFDLPTVGGETAQLILTGLDDELSGRNPIVITVNGTVIFDGPGPFESWNPAASVVGWSQVSLPFSSGLLVAGRNVIVVENRSPGGSVGLPPYILLSEASITVG